MTDLFLAYLLTRTRELRHRLAAEPDAGYTTETIAVIALMVVLALGVVGVITAKVMAKAKSIDLDSP